MVKTEKIIGLPVIDISTGNQVGKVWDVIINGEKGAADYFIIDDGLMILGAKVVASKDVQGIGEYALTIKKRDIMKEMGKTEPALDLYRKNVRVKETRVMTQKGKLIGEIQELYLDEDDASISALEFVAFNNSEVKIIPRKEVITFGENLTVVIGEFETGNEKKSIKHAEIEEQSDIKVEDNKVKKTENVKESLTYVDERKETVRGSDVTAIPVKQTAKEEKKARQPEKSLQEKTLTEKTVTTVAKENKVEIPKVEIPKEEDLMADEEYVAQEASNIEEKKEVVIEKQRIELEVEKELIGDDVFKEGIRAASYSYKPSYLMQPKTENKPKPINRPSADKSSNLFEQKQKEFLIGRKITKTIKDPKGNTILSEGQIITEEAVNMAKDMGKLIEIVMNNRA